MPKDKLQNIPMPKMKPKPKPRKREIFDEPFSRFFFKQLREGKLQQRDYRKR